MTNGFLAGYLAGYMHKQAQRIMYTSEPGGDYMVDQKPDLSGADFTIGQSTVDKANKVRKQQDDLAAMKAKWAADAAQKAQAEKQYREHMGRVDRVRQSPSKGIPSGTVAPTAPTSEEYKARMAGKDPLAQTGVTPNSAGAYEGQYGMVAPGGTGMSVAGMKGKREQIAGLTPAPVKAVPKAVASRPVGKGTITDKSGNKLTEAQWLAANTRGPARTQVAAAPAKQPGA